jgi:Fur family ferric uptake transcriptional regulator
MTASFNPTQNSLLTPGLQGRLQKCGYRITAPRQLVMNVLVSTTGHLSAEEIYIHIHKTNPNIGLATVYRTLDLLVRTGSALRLDFGQHKSRYELAVGHAGERGHNHLVCTRCGKVVNYTEDVAGASADIAVLEKKYNFDIARHQAQFFGLCGKCRIKKEGGDGRLGPKSSR